jgi:hypothetical protein
LETTNSLPFRQTFACFGMLCKNNQKFAVPSKTLPRSNLSRFSKSTDLEIGISNQQFADFPSSLILFGTVGIANRSLSYLLHPGRRYCLIGNH